MTAAHPTWTRDVPIKLHPQTRRHQANREKLEAAAIREFASHGLRGAKVSNIVAAAGLTQPSFYRTWPSKEAAYAEIVSQTREAWYVAARQVLDGPSSLPLKDRIYSGVHRLFQLLMHDHELTRMVLYESRLLPDRYEPFIEIYTGVFQTAQQRALITQRLPAETLAQAYTALTRRLFMARLYTRQLSVEAASREITELVYPLIRQEDL
ncbi:TetR/AcrR family transcriptional regulator [Deinococcus ficus]|uniref:TetR/AcrR family transcriptional regulator n=1 Tax=Deinococcus ficus TaxID=317577 RepID=UPI0003B69854|nr:TetR/AcrR family transcriptional regulator [Deinococcus ficus]